MHTGNTLRCMLPRARARGRSTTRFTGIMYVDEIECSAPIQRLRAARCELGDEPASTSGEVLCVCVCVKASAMDALDNTGGFVKCTIKYVAHEELKSLFSQGD